VGELASVIPAQFLPSLEQVNGLSDGHLMQLAFSPPGLYVSIGQLSQVEPEPPFSHVTQRQRLLPLQSVPLVGVLKLTVPPLY
jgi:hypothetical protein